MAVAKANLTGTAYQKVLTASGLSGKTVSNIELYKTGTTFVLAITPSAGNPAYFLFQNGNARVNSSGSGNDEWTSTGAVDVTPQAV